MIIQFGDLPEVGRLRGFECPLIITETVCDAAMLAPILDRDLDCANMSGTGRQKHEISKGKVALRRSRRSMSGTMEGMMRCSRTSGRVERKTIRTETICLEGGVLLA